MRQNARENIVRHTPLGLQTNASLAADGRRIRIGMRSDLTLTIMALPQLINTELLV